MLESSDSLSEEEISRLFGALLSQVNEQLSLSKARTVVAKAGITGLNADTEFRSPFTAAVEGAFYRLEPDARLKAIEILAEEFSNSEPAQQLIASVSDSKVLQA